MAAVEVALHEAVKSDFPFVAETSRHLVEAGGKRFRPLLVLLAAQLGDPSAPGVVPAAVVVELTHLATLYHDDVMDEAPLRRGAVSANARWDNTVAILTGDFLFARASDILADLGPEAVRIQARTFERLVTGPDPRDGRARRTATTRSSTTSRVVADKTGSLIATSGRFGAMLSGADDAVVDVMTRFGERIGIAFQLSDDILDVTSEAPRRARSRAPTCARGCRRCRSCTCAVRRRATPPTTGCSALLDSDLTDDARHAEALGLLRAHPAMQAATRRPAARRRRRPLGAGAAARRPHPGAPSSPSATRSSPAPPDPPAPGSSTVSMLRRSACLHACEP